MIEPAYLTSLLRQHSIYNFVGVPDSLLKSFCAYVSQTLDNSGHVIAANEGNAVAIAAGHYLATGYPSLVYMQNSGLGNAINPILSLADKEVYQIPMLLMIGWRGEPGLKDEPQHIKQGRLTPSILDALEIPWFEICANTKNLDCVVERAVSIMKEERQPVAIIVRKNTFAEQSLEGVSSTNNMYELGREEAIRLIVDAMPKSVRIVSTTGMASRELFESRAKAKQGHGYDFLTVGSMGHASSIAYGLARSCSNNLIVCLDGDGSLLMHLGACAITGTSKASNFLHIVLNNGAHDSVGGQPTVGMDIDIPLTAKALGYNYVSSCSTQAELTREIKSILELPDGPNMIEVRIKKGARKDLGRPTNTPQENLSEFVKELRGSYAPF